MTEPYDIAAGRKLAEEAANMANSTLDLVRSAEGDLAPLRLLAGKARSNVAELEALASALAAACDEVENLRDYIQGCLDPAPDEQHCACVPGLRAEIARLTAERNALREQISGALVLLEDWQFMDDDRFKLGVLEVIYPALRQARGEERGE